MASSDSSNEGAVVVASWDLTNRVSPYLDLHMMFPLLEYVDSLINDGMIAYDSSDVAAARLSLLRPTHMVDYAMDIYRELHGDDNAIPQEMEDQKAAVFVKLEELRNASKPLEDLLSNLDLKVSPTTYCYTTENDKLLEMKALILTLYICLSHSFFFIFFLKMHSIVVIF